MERTKMTELRMKHPKLGLPYCSCGDGWFDILDTLCTRLDVLELSRTFRINQIKEKFGELRFYVSGIEDKGMDQVVMQWIFEAMGESRHVCEECGKPGARRALQWIQTLCDECHAQRQ